MKKRNGFLLLIFSKLYFQRKSWSHMVSEFFFQCLFIYRYCSKNSELFFRCLYIDFSMAEKDLKWWKLFPIRNEKVQARFFFKYLRVFCHLKKLKSNVIHKNGTAIVGLSINRRAQIQNFIKKFWKMKEYLHLEVHKIFFT